MEETRVRRRLVQSTLFPHRDGSVKEAVNCNGNGEKQVEEEECSGGSSKKRTESKRKASSRSKKASPASSHKVTENAKETPSKQVDDRDSPIIEKSEAAMLSLGTDIPEASVSPRSTPQKRKRRDNSTPRKDRVNSTPNKKMKSGARELFCGQIPFDLTVDEQPLQTIPDLRLEAKLRAEENSRIFAGRQIHPFFTSRKGGKVSQDSTDTESNWFSFEKKEKCISFNPIHVFENVEDDHTTLDWGQWIFSERSDVGGLGCSPVYEGSVDSLNFDNLLSVSHLTRAALYQNSDQCPIPKREISMRLPGQPECSLPISPLSLADKTVICSEQKDSDMLPKDTENGQKTENLNSFAGRSCGESLASELEDTLLQERIMSHYHTCHSQPENSLWTDKYQPQNAKQICGNCESVNFLSEWLHLWHKRGSLTSRSRSTEDKSVARDIDHDYQQSDSDTDTMDDEESLKNVLLVTGPVGSGKSAAIYACARDQGFQVIEINASDWRNGALIKQKFGEAVESHWLQRTVENGPNSDNKPMSKFFTAVKAERLCSDNEAIELIDLSDKKDSEDAIRLKTSVCGEDITSSYQNDIKNLILFEDVDATLCEDHGFITTIQQLGETAKRPMILTSNSKKLFWFLSHLKHSFFTVAN
ncbi:hypothetical protein ACJIZ3_024596 [Penstemon smallii]|uniref:Uncharacterized protein n=1 Tax=Penstemon smallii TaxID=265156 RepID=A0ABD3TSL4_9LAMI